jgi:ABC-2 type transport system permease protein
MNRTLRAITAVVFICVIMFCAISIFQNLGQSLRVDLTEGKIYSLSDGTLNILKKLKQPVKLKLYYAKTAAMKGPDQIRFYNDYYFFVKELLGEYAANAPQGMIDYKVIDPRPYSEEEEEALRYDLKRFPITEEENFFFGLIVQTEFGVTKSIPFFSPDRQNFIEYDVSSLIDAAITREKSRIGVLSSLPVIGDDVTGYMAQMMRMQGQQPKPSWTIVEQLKQQFEVSAIKPDVEEIKNEDVDVLLVIHPKDLPEKTQFAIDQYVLKGGRTIICVDPHSIIDMPSQQAMMMQQEPPSSSSSLNTLLHTWGLEMPDQTFAGDRGLALSAAARPNERPQKVIAYIDLNKPECFNSQNVMVSNLNLVRMIFPGVLRPIAAAGEKGSNSQIELTPLLSTTNRGNTWKVTNPYELSMMDPSKLMDRFIDGTEPVHMAYFITGRFKSSFPNGVEVSAEPAKPDDAEEDKEKPTDPNTRLLTGLTEAAETTKCAVVVFADVDFISDIVAYQKTFFGAAPIGDNATLLLNAIDVVSGSSDLIAIRSRGNFTRPFKRIDEIEAKAEEASAKKVADIQAKISGFQQRLREMASTAESKDQALLESTALKDKQNVELEIRKEEGELQKVKRQNREEIEGIGDRLRNINMILVPAAILVVAIVLSSYRTTRRRRYISHASDA